MTEPPIIDFRKYVSWTSRLQETVQRLGLVASTLFYNILRVIFGVFFPHETVGAKGLSPRIVILGFGGIGNHLLLIPAIRMLHAHYPGARIDLLTSSSPSAELMQEVDGINAVHRIQATKKRVRDICALTRIIRNLRPDAFMGAAGIDPVFLSEISLFSGARWRIGADWHGRGFFLTKAIPLSGHVYEANQNMEIARLIADQCTKESVEKPGLTLRADILQQGRNWKKSLTLKNGTYLVGIHPGSGNEQTWKRWSVDKFAEVKSRLEEQSSSVCVFFLGPDEADLENLLVGAGVAPDRIFREKSIVRTASQIGQCQLFIANDSGLRQLAVSLGIPTVGIFGPTSAEKNFTSNGIDYAVTAKNVLCRPCHYTSWWLACKGKRSCLDDISVNTVVSLSLRSLQRK